MDLDRFWELVEAAAVAADGDCWAQAEQLTAMLEEIVSFERQFTERLAETTKMGLTATFIACRAGGLEALRNLGLFHAVERLSGPPDELVWAQLSADPYRVDRGAAGPHGPRARPGDAGPDARIASRTSSPHHMISTAISTDHARTPTRRR